MTVGVGGVESNISVQLISNKPEISILVIIMPEILLYVKVHATNVPKSLYGPYLRSRL